ncbi:MAG: dihydropyrimidine dehydrogenase subunit A [Syntrophus sp. (in: bacteria)]|nr:dihydropyrimidine dehydrogenase subunit A [Syntrophus sp. (in: bacteria)]
MEKIIFSSWQEELVDNRTAAEQDRRQPGNVKLPAEFRTGERIKAFMGWDGIVLCDGDVDIVDMCARYAEAVQSESCGKCFPCRVGTRLVCDWLRKIASGEGRAENVARIGDLARQIREGSKCSIGQTGMNPILHALKYFPQAFTDAATKGRKSPEGRYRFSVTAPCVSVCPSSLDIPRYVEEIGEQRFAESLATIRESICMAGTLGRVCIRPCESNCRRANLDESISIKNLKRFAADYEIEKDRHPKGAAAKSAGRKVAIIGAGPAGLSCAYTLALKGYQPTIFEKLPEPGGMAAVGIPDFRLPRQILGREVDIIKGAGVEIRYGVEVGKEITLTDLRKDYAAVFIGVGAHDSMPMGVEGEEMGYRGFIPGVRYLLDISQGKDPYPEGKKVVVVGGGNVAIDCVRSSFRIGKEDANLVYRRTIVEMPADPVEIHDAEEEKVKFHYLCNPTRILSREGKVVGVECIRMELGEPDKSGRRRPVPVAGSEFIIETDILIPAIGQKVNLSFLSEKDGIRLTKWNTIDADEETFTTSQEGVFASGDCVTGPDVLVKATGTGKKAAEKIDLYLSGGKVEASIDEKFKSLFSQLGVYNKKEQFGAIGGLKKAHLPMLEPETRKWSFDEVETGYKINEATDEAERCLRCYRIGMIAIG